MKMLYDLKEKLFDELKDFSKKDNLSSSEMEMIYKIASAIKNIGKICIMEEGGEESFARGGEWEADMRGSYERGNSSRRRHYVRGHYSREGGSSEEGGSYRGGSSYRGGGYSREGGSYRSGRGDWREEMTQTLEEMMEGSDDDREREAIRRCLEQVKRG